MSVIVKGMKMPENCNKCPCCDELGCAVKLRSMTTKQMSGNRPDWCPLVEIPPKHGRLIDGDALIENRFKNPISYNAFKNLIERQMTLIKEEGKDETE